MDKKTEIYGPFYIETTVNETAKQYGQEKRYTYDDYMTWDDDVRRELIDGIIYDMSPAPGSGHQSISMDLSNQLYNFLKGKTCKVFQAPFDVRLDPGGADDTVVQPDILIICDRLKITKTGCRGAPDIVIEILSPSNAKKDMTIKFDKYRQAGVKEIWMLDLKKRYVKVCTKEEGNYSYLEYINPIKIPVKLLDGFELDVAHVFDEADELVV